MKFFVGIDLGTTNSGRFESGGTVDALQRPKISRRNFTIKNLSAARQTLGDFFVTISATIACGC